MENNKNIQDSDNNSDNKNNSTPSVLELYKPLFLVVIFFCVVYFGIFGIPSVIAYIIFVVMINKDN